MENDRETLFEKLKAHHAQEIYPFHMPGHKRNLPAPGNLYTLDITEIGGFDSLHHADGVLRDISRRAARLYHAEETFLLINGSTAGLLCAVSAVLKKGGTLLMARNCHKAAYNAAYIRALKTIYLYPRTLEDWGICGGIAPEDVEAALAADAQIGAVLITSPTYEGVVSDVEAIAACCHRHGVPLLVDEAHGAHFGFSAGMPCSAVTLGADIVIQSLHKTMPALTQTALLHVNGTLVDRALLARFFSIYQTSSPSYVLMGSIDACIAQMETQGAELFAAYEKKLRRLRSTLGELQRLRLFWPDEAQRSAGAVYAVDPGRIMLSVRGAVNGGNAAVCDTVMCDPAVHNGTEDARSVSGGALLRHLREQYGLEMEMAGADYVVAIVTVADREEGLARLCSAAAQIDKALAKQKNKAASAACAESKARYGQKEANSVQGIQNKAVGMQNQPAREQAVVRMPIAAAYDAATERVLAAAAAGRISAEFLYVYPPGIPIVAPGEQIEQAHIRQIAQASAQGLSVEGLSDRTLQTIQVLCV